MNILSRISIGVLGALALAACASHRNVSEQTPMSDGLVSGIRVTTHQGDDDLLSAGLGLAGLRGSAPAFANPESPTPAELRRRAIYSSWRGIADLGPLGGYGEIYGAVPVVTGREFTAFAKLPKAKSPHRVLVQVPDLFDRDKRCVIVTASSGSRGVYGSISLAGAWGLPRGCAVAYTDKGTGSGYFDVASNSGVALDGTRAQRGSAQLEFAPADDATVAGSNQVLVKHTHSGDNPEADWGRHVIQAARFALAALDQAFPDQAPFTAENTRIIAAGLSNGGGAVLRAAEADDGLFDGVVAVEPNIWAGEGGRALYDYATEAMLLMPCALLDPRFDQTPFARVNGEPPPAWVSRCETLKDQRWQSAGSAQSAAAQALESLHSTGWTDDALASAATSTALDLWRAVTITYSAAYARTGVGPMPCGFGLAATDAGGNARAASPIEQAGWWADATGIPPGAGVGILDSMAAGKDSSWPGSECLSQLWSESSELGLLVYTGAGETRAALPRADLPMIIVHGEADGLVPVAFSSAPYVRWLEANGRKPVFWKVGHAQHFDAFLAFPGFGDAHVPMLPYAYAALDRLWAHIVAGEPLPSSRDIATTPRGNGPLGANQLGEY
ncbi:MAG: hydrogenase [Xanthomonadales bacterium]|nr:hydrogenase [Xanthomonadales bacterium]